MRKSSSRSVENSIQSVSKNSSGSLAFVRSRTLPIPTNGFLFCCSKSTVDMGKPAGARKLYFLAPMLSDWLSPLTLPLFKTIFMKAGYARPSTASGAWSVLHSVLCCRRREQITDNSRMARVILSQGSKLSSPQPILRLLNRMSSCRSEDPRHDIGLSIPAIFRSKISQVFFYQKLRFLFRNKPGCPCKGYSFSPDPLLDLFPVHLLLQLKNP